MKRMIKGALAVFEGRRVRDLVVAGLAVTVVSGCEVTNPGPVSDDYLTLPDAQQGFVNGAEERLNRALGYLTYTGGLVAREIFPGGQTGIYGHSVSQQAGQIAHDQSTQYNNAQQARWVAEEAVRRFIAKGDVAPRLLFEAHTWAGYANRVLAENWCEAVIDGGPEQPGSVYLQRAQDNFTKALALPGIAAEKRLAAFAGRAQIRLWLEDFAGAASDAQQITNDDYVFWLRTGSEADQRNHIFWAMQGSPYRAVTVRFTFIDQYYAQTGDPRTPWQNYPNFAVCGFSLQGYGAVPCTQQRKYLAELSDWRLASGREMRLIEAEALLAQGSWEQAMTKINNMRTAVISTTTGQPLQPWTANNLVEAWTVLKRERGIELWLEGRRMGDQRRWEPILGQQKTPGDLELPNFEARSTVFTTYPRGRNLVFGQDQPRALCFAISNAERENNPNFPQGG